MASAVALFVAMIPKQENELAKSMERGKNIYAENCMSCHLGEGEGVPETFPPLAKSDYLQDSIAAIRAIKFGLMGKIKVNKVEYDNMMPSPGLGDAEIADVMNYIRNSWGNTRKAVITTKLVSEVKEQ